MSSVDFPEAAKQAALLLVQKWARGGGYSMGSDLETLLHSVECDLMNELGLWRMNYGVEDAIRAGTQVRLLDQIDIKKPRLNCSEVGVNLFLIYSALGAGDRVRLMRFNDGRESDHFALLHYDRGFDHDPIILDPLWHKFGRMHFTSNGVVYTPNNLLPENRIEGAQVNDSKERIQHFKYKDISFLTQEEVVRHVNFLNSPLGFFQYFGAGQKIKETKEQGFIAQYAVQTFGSLLSIRVTCGDHALDFSRITASIIMWMKDLGTSMKT